MALAGTTAWWFFGGADSRARSQWQPPADNHLSSMRMQPVPGWKSDVTALGLPAGSRITTDDAPGVPGPVIDTQDDRAYLLARSDGPAAPRWWLVGVSARDGRAAFPPIELSTNVIAPSCFPNAIAIVCISDDQNSVTAWVIDARTGEVNYVGATSVRLSGTTLRATRAGDHLVAATKGEGIHGIGPQAETTWFAPGLGVVASAGSDVAVQGDGESSDALAMFSLDDGEIITPELPDGGHIEQVEFFDGGFAAYVAEGSDPFFVQFFDTTGRLTSRERFHGVFGGSAANVTALLEADDHVGIYGPDGGKLLDLTGAGPNGMQLVGTTLYVGETNSSGSRPYDLRTGAKGVACDFDTSPTYLGTDGSVAVRAVLNLKADTLAKAYDLATCDTAWSIPRPPGSRGKVFRVGDTLVQLSDDGTTLNSLVAPN